MADKPLAVRIPEDIMKVLESRVEEINCLMPEASVTVSSIVRYAIGEYTDRLKKNEIQTELVFPFANELDGYSRQSFVEQGIIDSQDELVVYNEYELGQLGQGLEMILNVWRNKQNVSSQKLRNWEDLYKNLTREYAQVQLARLNQEQLDAQSKAQLEHMQSEVSLLDDDDDDDGIQYSYECPVCCETFYENFKEVPDTVYCHDCKEEFEAYEGYSKYENQLILVKEWTEENEKWEIFQRANGLNRKDEEAEIDRSTYEELTEEEQKNYRECDVCGNIYEKYTGVCRLDESSGLYECKSCRR